MIFVEVLYFGGDLSESLPAKVKQPRTRCLKSASEDRKAASKHARPSDQESREWIERTSRVDNPDRCDLSEYLPDVFSMPQHFLRVMRLLREIHGPRHLFMRGTPFPGYLSNCVNTHGNALCIGPGRSPFFIDLGHPLLQCGLQVTYPRQVLVQGSCLRMAQSFTELLMVLDHVRDGGLELLLLDGKDLVIVQPTSVATGHPASQLAHNVRRRHAIGK